MNRFFFSDPIEGIIAANRAIEGLSRKAAAVDPGYTARTREACCELALTGQPFTSEHVLAKVGYPDMLDHRVIGTVMKNLHREHWIAPTGRYVKAGSKSRHGAPIREWVGR